MARVGCGWLAVGLVDSRLFGYQSGFFPGLRFSDISHPKSEISGGLAQKLALIKLDPLEADPFPCNLTNRQNLPDCAKSPELLN